MSITGTGGRENVKCKNTFNVNENIKHYLKNLIGFLKKEPENFEFFSPKFPLLGLGSGDVVFFILIYGLLSLHCSFFF